MSCADASASFTVSTLDLLPSLVLETICDHLIQCDGRRTRSLAAFALTSRRLAIASESRRFRRILLKPSGEDDLVRVVEEMRDVLGSTRLVYVRDLTFAHSCAVPFDCMHVHWAARDSDVDSTWPFHHVPKRVTMPRFDDLGPLVRLIESMPGLVELHWAGQTNIIPPILLRALEQRHPAIRLDIFNFDLEGLRQASLGERPRPRDGLSQEEWALAVSPSLDAVNICDTWDYDTYGFWDYHAEAVQDMAKLGNLRHVAVTRSFPGNSIELQDLRTHGPGTPRAWLGLGELSVPRAPTRTSPQQEQRDGRLESLVLWGIRHSQHSHIHKWLQCTKLSTLCRLELDLVTPETLQLLEANGHLFAALSSLSLTINQRGDDNEAGYLGHAKKGLGRLLRTLPPLQHLKLTPFEASELFASPDILDRHGPALRSLYLYPESGLDMPGLESQQIERICASCRCLQRLAIGIRRTQSNAAEVALYRALGRLPFLESVTLRTALYGDRDLSSKGVTFSGADYRKVLENAAVDKKLATSLFSILATSQMAATGLPYDSLPLYRVKIVPLVTVPTSNGRIITYNYLHHDIEAILSALGHTWICERRMVGIETREEVTNPNPAHELPEGYEDGLEWLEEPDFCGAWTDLWGDEGVNKGSIPWANAWWSTLFPMH